MDGSTFLWEAIGERDRATRWVRSFCAPNDRKVLGEMIRRRGKRWEIDVTTKSDGAPLSRASQMRRTTHHDLTTRSASQHLALAVVKDAVVPRSATFGRQQRASH